MANIGYNNNIFKNSFFCVQFFNNFDNNLSQQNYILYISFFSNQVSASL